jgi:2-amino-4-hydroxy-6-hydroxymethyldihydropteridine diphosphokinase
MPEARTVKPRGLAAVGLGSNLSSRFGDPADNLREALRHLEGLGRVTAASTFHATDPVGYIDQPRFLNAAALLTTELSPQALLRGLLAIEHTMGRNRSVAPLKGPRVIDLDLLLYDEVVCRTPDLVLPHPAMHERRFVLAPLAEIAPKMQHPTVQRSIGEMLAAMDGTQ